MSELDYVSQTLTKAISVLATHPGGIAERMKRAYAELHPITVDKLPDDLKGDGVHIEVELGIGEGDVPARIDSLSEPDLSLIAIQILSFADRADTFLREEGS